MSLTGSNRPASSHLDFATLPRIGLPLALVRLAPLAQDFEGFRIPYDDFVLFDADVQAGIDELFVTDPGLVPLPLLPFPLGGLEVTVRSARCPPASSCRRACSRACRSGASTPALRSVTRTNRTTTPHAFGKLPVVQSALPVAVSTDPLIAVTSDYAPWGLSQPTVAVTDLTSP